MKREYINRILPDIKSIEESIITANNHTVGYHCSIRLQDGSIKGSGCHSKQSSARIISLAEAMERTLFRSLLADNTQRCDFLLDEYPTSCGFALGTSLESTTIRAKAEAVERWLRSKWIDDCFRLEQSQLRHDQFSELARYFYYQFDSVLTFRTSNILQSSGGPRETYFSCIVVGLKGPGAFVGSRTSISEDNLEEHALIEAWRHLHISNNINQYPDQSDYRQILYFGQHAKEALKQIDRATRSHLPEPELRLLKQADTGFPDLFLFRALCKDFRGWHGPDFTRFVY